MNIEQFQNMSIKPVTIAHFAKNFVCDDDCPPGTFKLQKMMMALDKHAVSGPPLGMLDRSQKSADKQGYYNYDWSDSNPYDERPIWMRKGLI